jgi:hypothetical protein
MFDNPILNDNPNFNEKSAQSGNPQGFTNPTQYIESSTPKSNTTKYIIGGLISIIVVLVVAILVKNNASDYEQIYSSSYASKEYTPAKDYNNTATYQKPVYQQPQTTDNNASYIPLAPQDNVANQGYSAQEELAKEVINMAIAQGITAIINNPNTLNIRDEPNINSNIVGNIPYGGIVTLMKLGPKDIVNDFTTYWVWVNYQGTEGWVWGRWVQIQQ